MGKHCARLRYWCCSVLLLPWCGSLASPAAAKDEFTLASAVPADVFMYVAARHNPEADFIHGYWHEVFEAFHASGVIEDVMGMVSSALGEEQKAEMERLKGLATQLCAGVDWEAMAGGETVYTMRMPRAIQQGDNFNVGPADMAWIIKGVSGSAAKNFEGLTAILDTIAAEINKAAGSEVVKLDKTPIGKAKAVSLGGPTMYPGQPRLTVAHVDEVILIVVSDKFQDEIVSLLESGTGNSLVKNARFKAAFTSLPAAENCMVFIDMQQMVKDLHGIADKAFSFGERMGAGPRDREFPELTGEAKTLHEQSMAAYDNKDVVQALALCEKAHALAPTDTRFLYNLACFNNLNGNREQALTWLEKAVEAGFDQVQLLSTDSDLESLRADGRFQAALTKARTQAANQPAGGPDEAEQIKMAKNLVNRALDMPAIVDYIAEVDSTDGYSTRNESLVMLAPDASSKPFYAVVASGKPIANFATYVPQEATSFAVDSGIDWRQLYKFLEDTVKGLGPQGEQVLAQWSSFQQQSGFDIQRDFLSWMESQTISMTMQRPTGEATVTMLAVSNEAVAGEKLNSALDALAAFIQQNAQSNPMLGMMNVRSAPCLNEKLKGFRNVFIGMMPTPMVLGVANGYMIFGSSEDAVLTCLATGAGEHPNVSTNAEIMAQAIKPDSGATSVKFEDMRQLGNQLAGAVGMISMMGGFAAMAVPDPEAQQMIGKITAILGKLSPVMQKIDFYRSTSSVCNFDGKSWRTKSVTHYQSPEERKASTTPPPVTATP